MHTHVQAHPNTHPSVHTHTHRLTRMHICRLFTSPTIYNGCWKLRHCQSAVFAGDFNLAWGARRGRGWKVAGSVHLQKQHKVCARGSTVEKVGGEKGGGRGGQLSDPPSASSPPSPRCLAIYSPAPVFDSFPEKCSRGAMGGPARSFVRQMLVAL